MQDWTNVVENGPPERQFLRPVWFRAWEMAYGDERNWRRPVRYRLLSRDASSQCVLPLATQRFGPFRFASLCGTFFPFRGIPYCGDPKEVAALVIPALHEQGSTVGARLGPMTSSDPLLTAMLTANRRCGGRVLCRDIGTEFGLENPGSAEQFAASLSSKRRQKIEYYWRRLSKAGATELCHFQRCQPHEWANVLRDLRTVEAASWVAESGQPLFLGVRNELFWATLTSDPWFCESLHAWIIYHAGSPVSFALAMDAGGVRYVYANSFDARVAEYRTGTKIYQQLICDAFSRGLRRINFGLGDSGYKTLWGAEPVSKLVELIAFSPGLVGSLAYLAAHTKEWATRWRRRRMPAPSDVPDDTAAPPTSPAKTPARAAAEPVEVTNIE